MGGRCATGCKCPSAHNAAAIFVGLERLEDRIERLARELASFYDRNQPTWQMYEREPELIRVWGGGVEGHYADIDSLMRVALGELGEAVTLTLDLALPWLERRRDELATRA